MHIKKPMSLLGKGHAKSNDSLRNAAFQDLFTTKVS